MTLDERVRSDLKTAASLVPHASSSDPGEAIRRGRRRRLARRTRWSFVSVALFLGVLALVIPYDPNSIDPADTYDVFSVEIADLAVAVVDPEPISADPDLWIGLPGPAPRFDTSDFGPDLSFTPGTPSPDDLNDRIRRAVYLGELDGEPFYLFSTDAPSIWDRLFELIDGNLSGDVLGTSLSCCTGGDMDHEGGLSAFSLNQTAGQPDLIVGEWLGLSPAVSVVAYQLDGVFVGWQTPVGGVSTIRPDHFPAEFLVITFDADGQEVDRLAPPPLSDQDGMLGVRDEEVPGSEWAPLDSGGIEISPADIPTAELREVIAPQAGDRIFAVTTNGQEILVVIRSTEPHAYATSCAVLAAVDLPPGWEGTCLERTVNGQRESGVFEYQEVTSQDG
ncbi:MAG TPA: hypothetical protein VJA46_03340 [Acidimicrobiia bacterium]|nr:hypothetical protein [Acidimicrobiia bacterium]